MKTSKWRRGGVREAKFFLLEIQLLRYLGDPFAKKNIFGDPPCALQHYSAEKRPLQKMDAYEQKLQLRVGNFKNQVFPKIVSQCFRRRMGGIHAPNFFILEVRLLWYFKDTFAKL